MSSETQKPTLGNRLTDYQNPNSPGSRFRRARAAQLLPLLAEIYSRKGKVDILDVGGRRLYWNIIPLSTLISYKVKKIGRAHV